MEGKDGSNVNTPKVWESFKGEGVLPVTMSQAKKIEMVEKARSVIILCLGDKVLGDVAKEPTAASMWSKLKSLYMTKSLAHRQFLKQQLYSEGEKNKRRGG